MHSLSLPRCACALSTSCPTRSAAVQVSTHEPFSCWYTSCVVLQAGMHACGTVAVCQDSYNAKQTRTRVRACARAWLTLTRNFTLMYCKNA